MKNLPALLAFCLLLAGCRTYKAGHFIFPEPVDTADRPVILQQKKTYKTGGIYASNQFDGARLNDFKQLNDSTFQATILPENTPINKSPWYAFQLWADAPRQVNLVLHYEHSLHRYRPKISRNGKDWDYLDSTLVQRHDSTDALLKLTIGPDTLWLAAQEVTNSAKVKTWVEKTAQHPAVSFKIIGKSKLGRDMYFLDIGEGEPKKKDIIVVLSRQHPPEVTGFIAMQLFVEELLKDNPLANNFRKKYRILVFPLMNPDGVDLGHWRHNAGGIDLNRDWAYYRQPETNLAANFIVESARRSKSKVILGLDFHSTQEDVYYTFTKEMVSVLPNYKDYWLMGIEDAIPGYKADDQPAYLNQPISKGWFYQQFKAESITYEIGDETPRDFIKQKARVAAVEMMELLIFR